MTSTSNPTWSISPQPRQPRPSPPGRNPAATPPDDRNHTHRHTPALNPTRDNLGCLPHPPPNNVSAIPSVEGVDKDT